MAAKKTNSLADQGVVWVPGQGYVQTAVSQQHTAARSLGDAENAVMMISGLREAPATGTAPAGLPTQPGALPQSFFAAQTTGGSLFDSAPVWVWVAGALVLGAILMHWYDSRA